VYQMAYDHRVAGGIMITIGSSKFMVALLSLTLDPGTGPHPSTSLGEAANKTARSKWPKCMSEFE
jgi:hypothetical protein